MKQNKLFFIILTALGIMLYSFSPVYAQNSVVKVGALIVKPVLKNYPVDTAPGPDSINVFISFMVSDIAKVDSVFILFGSVADSADFISVCGAITNSGNRYLLTINGVAYPIQNLFDIRMTLPVPTQKYNQTRYVTVYIKDEFFLQSNHLTKKTYN